eukprot:FR739846.1.p1 GENE.FR739846.1~~FR739846.1.p1  ORF type:complete len:118 (+),score=0.62 FR739846.1:2-355(+)
MMLGGEPVRPFLGARGAPSGDMMETQIEADAGDCENHSQERNVGENSVAYVAGGPPYLKPMLPPPPRAPRPSSLGPEHGPAPSASSAGAQSWAPQAKPQPTTLPGAGPPHATRTRVV